MVTSDRERDSNPISKSRNNITNNGGRRVGNRIEGSEAILSAVRQVVLLMQHYSFSCFFRFCTH